MFKSITYLRYDRSSDKDIYHLVDDNFECEVAVAEVEEVAAAAVAAAAEAAAEYHKRNLDIVRNLYLLNRYIQQHPNWYNNGCTFSQILEWQNKYIDKYHPIPGINFSKEIYPKLKEMYETLNIFK